VDAVSKAGASEITREVKIKKRFALHFSLSLQMIAAQLHKKANWSRKTIAIQDSFLPLSL
jgi:hypothetical protein